MVMHAFALERWFKLLQFSIVICNHYTENRKSIYLSLYTAVASNVLLRTLTETSGHFRQGKGDMIN